MMGQWREARAGEGEDRLSVLVLLFFYISERIVVPLSRWVQAGKG